MIKRIWAFVLLVVFCTGCSKNAETSSSKEDRYSITEESVNNYKDKDASDKSKESKKTTEKIVQVYSGPGEDYYKEAEIDTSNIIKIEKIEGKWSEISYEDGGRGYVLSDSIKEMDGSDAFIIVNQINQNITINPQMYSFKIPYKLTGEIDFLPVPGNGYPSQIVKAEEEVLLINKEPSQIKNPSAIQYFTNDGFWQIEATTSRGKERGYVSEKDLFDVENPLKNFEKIKDNNAKAIYKGDFYYSASGAIISGFQTNWYKKDELNIKTDISFNFIDGILGIVSTDSEDITSALKNQEQQLYLSEMKKGKYNYFETKTPITDTNLGAKINIALFLADEMLTFLNGAITPECSYNIQFQRAKGEGKIVIRTGAPIECAKQGRCLGKEFEFSSLIDDGSIIGGSVQNATFVDRLLRNAYPELTGENNYSLRVTYGNYEDVQRNPYGYYVVIDKDMNVYYQLILHDNTRFVIYYDRKPVKDISTDLCKYLYKLNEKEAKSIIQLLEENGIIFQNQNVITNGGEETNKITENNDNPEFKSYSEVIHKLKNDFGDIEFNSYYSQDESTNFQDYYVVEACGLCYTELIDFDNDGEDELLAVAKHPEDDEYTVFIYTTEKGGVRELSASKDLICNFDYNYINGRRLVIKTIPSQESYIDAGFLGDTYTCFKVYGIQNDDFKLKSYCCIKDFFNEDTLDWDTNYYVMDESFNYSEDFDYIDQYMVSEDEFKSKIDDWIYLYDYIDKVITLRDVVSESELQEGDYGLLDKSLLIDSLIGTEEIVGP